MLSDPFLIAKFTFLLIFLQHFVNFCFSYSDRFLVRLSGWLLEWGADKMEPGNDFTGPEGSQCFQGGPFSCSWGKFEKLCLRIDVLGYFENAFQSMTKKLVKLSNFILRMSSGLFVLSLCFF